MWWNTNMHQCQCENQGTKRRDQRQDQRQGRRARSRNLILMITINRPWDRTVTVMSHNILPTIPGALTIVTAICNKNGLYVVSITSTVSDRVNAFIIANKPRGLQAARKLRTTRRENRWVRSQ
jgi:hypothetical protein